MLFPDWDFKVRWLVLSFFRSLCIYILRGRKEEEEEEERGGFYVSSAEWGRVE